MKPKPPNTKSDMDVSSLLIRMSGSPPSQEDRELEKSELTLRLSTSSRGDDGRQCISNKHL